MTGVMLRDARRPAGLSQTDLARRAHTSRPTLSAYDHGRTSPSSTTPGPPSEREGAGRAAGPDTTPLTPFQLEVSSAFFDLPESRGFLLAQR